MNQICILTKWIKFLSSPLLPMFSSLYICSLEICSTVDRLLICKSHSIPHLYVLCATVVSVFKFQLVIPVSSQALGCGARCVHLSLLVALVASMPQLGLNQHFHISLYSRLLSYVSWHLHGYWCSKFNIIYSFFQTWGLDQAVSAHSSRAPPPFLHIDVCQCITGPCAGPWL